MHDFRNVNGHIEVYLHGVFQFSADSVREAEAELGGDDGQETTD